MKVNELVQPGDILAVNTGTSWGNVAIRVGQLLSDRKWSWANHVIMVHHIDPAGTLWGIEGRPGGVGWIDISSRDYAYVSHNAWQAKTSDQRTRLCDWGESVLGTAYDWTVIQRHAMEALGIPALWREQHRDGAPAHVVCSSVWAYAYAVVGLARPLEGTDARYVRPADWDRHNRSRRS